MCIHAIRDCAPAHNNNFSSEERDLRSELALILARRAVPPAALGRLARIKPGTP